MSLVRNPNSPAIKSQNGGARSKTTVAVAAMIVSLRFMTPACADIDAMQLRLLDAYSQDLRWYNIESDPEWLNGVKPDYDKDWRMHRVILAPRQQTTVILPAYESLRLHNPKQRLSGDELDVLVSNGTGLAVKQALRQSSDGHSLVLSPNSATPLLVHIDRPGFYTGNFAIALFVSRMVPLNTIAPYRILLGSSAPRCLLAQKPFVLPELYQQLSAWEKQSFEVTGPVRLMLKNRLHYESKAGEPTQDYRIRYWLDDAKAQALDFSTSVETRRIITVNADIVVTGREERGYLEIPAGRHKLVLQADRDVYLQVLAQTEQDYLFGNLNKPRVSVDEIRRQGLLPTTELPLQAKTAVRTAHDNRRQAGGMAASNSFREAALQRRDYPAGLAETEQLQSLSSFYRDLLPGKKASPVAQFMAYFLAETLADVNRTQGNAVLADQHLSAALKRVSSAYFTVLPGTKAVEANEYTLPTQQSTGQLRLIIDKRDCVERVLRIQIDRQPAGEIRLRCDIALNPEAFASSMAKTALLGLQQEHDALKVGLPPFFFGLNQAPAPFIAAAVYELPVPKDARTVTLRQVAGPDAPPVNAALQYRAAKAFVSSEHSYLARLLEARDKRPFATFLQNLAAGTDSPIQLKVLGSPSEPLPNEWVPLQRLLQSEYRLYKASVIADPTEQATLAGDVQVVDDEIALADSAEKRGQWLEALEHRAKVVNSSSGPARHRAQLAQANDLSKLGEDYLAETLRRYLSLYADAGVAESAVIQLSEQYRAQNNNAALQTLAAAMLVHRPTVEHRRLLLNALMKNGEYRFALLLGLSFFEPAAEQAIERVPLEAMLTAAYQLEWWETYDRLQNQLPPARRAFWQGLKAQQHGDYKAALKAWSAVELQPWHDYLQQGLQLRDRLMQVTEQNAVSIYKQWSDWQQRYPGSTTWQNALWHVKDYAGGDSYYAVERDVYSQAVRATVERPVVLGVMGPVTLNLQIRPLHRSSQADSAIDGWLQINDNNDTTRYPFSNNLPAQGLRVTGADDLQVGNVVSLVYQVGQGWHEVHLSSEQAPLSIGIQEQRPELALSVLPVLHPDSFAGMTSIGRAEKVHTADKSVFKWLSAWK